MITDIQPITIPTKGTGDKFIIRVVSYSLGSTSAQFYWAVMHIEEESSLVILDGNINMSSPEIDSWGTDDSYVIDWALNELNFTKA